MSREMPEMPDRERHGGFMTKLRDIDPKSPLAIGDAIDALDTMRAKGMAGVRIEDFAADIVGALRVLFEAERRRQNGG